MLKRESFSKSWGIAYQFDLSSMNAAKNWQGDGLRASTDGEATALKLQVRLHKVEDLIVHDRPILALVEPVAFLVHDQPLGVTTDFL